MLIIIVHVYLFFWRVKLSDGEEIEIAKYVNVLKYVRLETVGRMRLYRDLL